MGRIARGRWLGEYTLGVAVRHNFGAGISTL